MADQPEFDGVLIVSNGIELKAFAICSTPLKVITTRDPRRPVPAGLSRVFSKDEARKFLKDVIDAQK